MFESGSRSRKPWNNRRPLLKVIMATSVCGYKKRCKVVRPWQPASTFISPLLTLHHLLVLQLVRILCRAGGRRSRRRPGGRKWRSHTVGLMVTPRHGLRTP